MCRLVTRLDGARGEIEGNINLIEDVLNQKGWSRLGLRDDPFSVMIHQQARKL